MEPSEKAGPAGVQSVRGLLRPVLRVPEQRDSDEEVGDRGSLESLHEHLGRLHNLAPGPTCNAQDAEDLLQETCLLALRGWRRLPSVQREAITLRDLSGYTAGQVAEITGSPRGTVLARVHRGRKALAALLEDREVDGGARP